MLDLFLFPGVAIGVILGIGVAALVHAFAPEPEPILLEAFIVALGAIVGLGLEGIGTKDRKNEK